MDENVVFDVEAALNRVEGDEALYRELVELFLSDYENTLAAISGALHDGNHTQVERSAHSIKSSLGNLGAMKAQSAAFKLELAGRNKSDLSEIKGDFSSLKNEIALFIDAVHKRFS